MNELLVQYINGNHADVKKSLADNHIDFGEFFIEYIDRYHPDLDQMGEMRQIKLFVRRLAK